MQQRAEQLLHRVVAEEGGEQHADRGEVRDRRGRGGRDALRGQPAGHGRREFARQAGHHQGEEDADRQHERGVLEGGDHAARRPAPVGRDRVHHLRPVRREEQAGAEPVEGDDDRELPVGEVHRDEYQQQEARSGQQRAAHGERLGAELVGQYSGQRRGHQEAGRQRHQVDAGPQRGLAEVVAVQRQPDALQPDDQHELHAAAAHRQHQARDVPGGERPDPEQRDAEQRLGDLGLDVHEDDQQREAAEERGEHPRVGPAHRMPAVGQQAVGDADQDRDQPGGEQQVAPPVHLRVLAYPDVMQHEVRPHGAEHADRCRDEEDQVPVHRGEDAAEDEADERPGDGRDRVHAAARCRAGWPGTRR